MILPALLRLKLIDISIRHHWTGDKITLDPIKHKDYWFHGKNRINKSMLLLPDLIRKGDSVLEIGGHIGYLSLYFANLTGREGRVTVFEPGPNNLPYIRKNTKGNSCISVIDKAVTDYTGTAKFFIENLTGQNNSLLEDFELRNKVHSSAYINSVEKNVVEVDCITLDGFLVKTQLPISSFIKIDCEGAELNALIGMKTTIGKNKIVIMILVLENANDVFSLLADSGFKMFSPDKSPIRDGRDMKGYIFCVKENDDRIMKFKN